MITEEIIDKVFETTNKLKDKSSWVTMLKNAFDTHSLDSIGISIDDLEQALKNSSYYWDKDEKLYIKKV